MTVNRFRLIVLFLSLGLFALSVAYGAEHFFGFRPCALCYYQRWVYFALVFISGLSLFIPRAYRVLGLFLCGVSLLVGTGVSLYQIAVEQHWVSLPASCGGLSQTPVTLADLKAQMVLKPLVPCDEVTWTFAGISMAGYNALISTFFAFIAFGGVWFFRKKGPYNENDF